jgi:hypothetical protein
MWGRTAAGRSSRRVRPRRSACVREDDHPSHRGLVGDRDRRRCWHRWGSCASLTMQVPVALASETRDSPEPEKRAAAPLPLGHPKPLSSSLAAFALPDGCSRLLAVGCGLHLHAYNAAAGRQGRAFGPPPAVRPDGAPLTAISGVVRLGHASHPTPEAPVMRTGTASSSRTVWRSAADFR